jgi:hypothetical protein
MTPEPKATTCGECYAPTITTKVRLCPKHASVDALLKEAKRLLDIMDESLGIIGWHLNGAVAPWPEFGFFDDLRPLIQAATTEGQPDAAEQMPNNAQLGNDDVNV